ncbi:class I SAM-dependent methyltransferase [Sphingomonas sp. RB56-2]|uniref:Class I SAM-dependent methyltransferase n=1 Tax=Sphingomonas brevis TaxID=2908206 RepID=A0ABT0S7M1_9SPHN|nr:class I SAM-dependent methyltransferase [Sphingomonas brevis]MCL6740394.1 class I SAM-dependent methyltransferase [Sphingomonas brevis]
MNEDWSRFYDPELQQPLRKSSGSLANAVGRQYPIVDSIPRFVSRDNYAADFGAQWNRFPATQLDSHTGRAISESRLARCFRGELPAVAGRAVLEAGSGAGRFTEILLNHGAVLDSFDFSAAVEANGRNNGKRRMNLAQADIRAMPFCKNAYDYVVCLGVLQHTPDTEESIGKLWQMVAPGGRLIIDHYCWNLWLRLPPPLGDAEKLYRQLILRLPREKRWPAVKRLVDFWFPIYWRFRDNRLARKILARVGGIHFYFGQIELGGREAHYEWSLLDTHDGMTDAYKRYRTPRQIRRALQALGAVDINVRKGGNGIEAWCRKPAS